jgi:hypothetical protein
MAMVEADTGDDFDHQNGARQRANTFRRGNEDRMEQQSFRERQVRDMAEKIARR